MKIRWKKLVGCLSVFLCILMLAGCQGTSNDVPQVTKAVEDAMQEDQNADVEPLGEQNEIPSDGVISAAQMSTIAGKEGTYYFNGKTEDGIVYQWAYDGSKIQNPVEQKLKVSFSTEEMEEIKKAANDAPYGLSVTLQNMELAAPATLTVTLTEQWNADKVLYCTYENGKLYQMDEAQIQAADGNVSQISFQVTKADGTYYLLGGSTTGTGSDDSNAGESQQGDVKETDEPDNADTKDSSKSEGGEKSSDNKKSDADSSDKDANPTCTISIECKEILKNMDDLKDSKAEFVPSDGWILYPSEVEFTPGDTVFDVLKRVCKDTDIHMASRYTPMYGSYYIEAINQLYEFDCGSRSGWMFSVNGWYPNYGCSEYKVEKGDRIEWRYTCNLGSDVGKSYNGGKD